MSEKLKEHLVKQGAEALQPLLGKETVELLTHVAQEALAANVMAELILTSKGAPSILKDDVTRQALIDKLGEEDLRNLCEALGVSSAMPRRTISLFDFKRPTAESTLFEWYGVPYPEDDSLNKELSRNISSKEKLTIFQQSAYSQIRQILNVESKKVLVHMPFGAGKLRAVTTAVLDAFRSGPENKVVLWLASDSCLCEEVFKEIETIWDQFGLRDITAYRLFGGRKISPLDSVRNAVVIADITCLREAFQTWAKNKIDVDESLANFGSSLSYLVLADAEHIILPEIQLIIDKMKSGGGKFNIIGICASPGPASEENPPIKIIYEAFDRCFIQIDECEPLTALQSTCNIDNISTEFLPSPVTELEGADDPISLPPDIAKNLASNIERNKFLFDKLIEISSTEERIVFYATTALQARMFAGLLALNGRPSSAVTGEMPTERRIQEIARFNSDAQKQVLCVHGTLVAASNLKKITAVVIALPTTSGALLQQMVGRLATDRDISTQPLKVFAIKDPVPTYVRLVENLGHWTKLLP